MHEKHTRRRTQKHTHLCRHKDAVAYIQVYNHISYNRELKRNSVTLNCNFPLTFLDFCLSLFYSHISSYTFQLDFDFIRAHDLHFVAMILLYQRPSSTFQLDCSMSGMCVYDFLSPTCFLIISLSHFLVFHFFLTFFLPFFLCFIVPLLHCFFLYRSYITVILFPCSLSNDTCCFNIFSVFLVYLVVPSPYL